MADESELWTLEELAERVGRAVGDQDLEQASGRVRQVPDGRTIRYYTTLGILDRPAGVKDRRRLYGERHLRQLLAIKRLQAEGLSLAEIQRALLGAGDERLAELSGRPAPGPAAAAQGAGAERAFWRPAPDRGGVKAAEAVSAVPLVALRLGPQVSVHLAGLSRQLTAGELRALAAAAEPFLAEARRLGLIDVSPPGGANEKEEGA